MTSGLPFHPEQPVNPACEVSALENLVQQGWRQPHIETSFITTLPAAERFSDVRFDWNRLLEKDPEQQLTGWLFLKLLALIYFAAFCSLSVQINGLAGPGGILPFEELLNNAERSMGASAWLRLPTLFWIDAGDTALLGATILGMLLSVLLFLNIRPRLSLLLMFLLYLSLFHAGQIFMSFQWDYLLMETGLLALFVVGGPSRLVIFMFHWLLFRLRFLSGISKLLSGDPTWSGMTALNYYFETQPLPHAGAWYAHQLPEWMLQAGVGLTFFAELVVPFFIFLPRRFRLFAAGVTILIQLLIIATSNHNFINLLTILLCLFLLDDRIVGRLLPGRIRKRIGQDTHAERRQGIGVVVVSAVILSASIPGAVGLSLNTRLPDTLQNWMIQVSHFGVGNVYHIFPTMQTERQELIIEGSNDSVNWYPYLFRYKPHELDRRPPVNIPHQPRLDWMIWFVPPRSPENLYWFDRFMHNLWTGNPRVTGLLRYNPFPHRPPRYLRVLVYRYKFTTDKEREITGNWWKAEYLGQFHEVAPRRP
ncbi:MAG: lipase maturation factor family protein [Gammaproteobacteria bacterium]